MALPAITSATGGIFVPDPAFGLDEDDRQVSGLDTGALDGGFPLTGTDLDRMLGNWLADVAGMNRNNVFPRWQPEPPGMQDVAASDWAAFGVTERPADTFVYLLHDPTANGGAGQDTVVRHQEPEALASFSGPNADYFMEALRDGAQLGQNLEALEASGISLVETGKPVTVPSLVKERWQYRVDVPVRFRRQTKRTYAVLNVLTAQGTIDAQP